MLGLVIVAGARTRARRRHALQPAAAERHRDAAAGRDFIIVLVGLTHSAHDAASRHIKTISIIGACVILVVYGVWLRPVPDLAQPAARRASERARLSGSRASSSWSPPASRPAFVSDWFVNALEPTIHTLHISQAFAGLVIVAIAGNAVENVGRDRARRQGPAPSSRSRSSRTRCPRSPRSCIRCSCSSRC